MTKPSRTGLDLAIYGREMDNATSALARMNMVLHDCPTVRSGRDNTCPARISWNEQRRPEGVRLTWWPTRRSPTKAWTSGLDPANEYGRFGTGRARENGDYAFLLHMLRVAEEHGQGGGDPAAWRAVPGGAEGGIRTRLVRQGVIQAIIGLPANLFYGTGIPACIIVIDKAGAAGRSAAGGIFMVDASKGFVKDGNKNRLREQDIHRIVDTFTRQLECPATPAWCRWTRSRATTTT